MGRLAAEYYLPLSRVTSKRRKAAKREERTAFGTRRSRWDSWAGPSLRQVQSMVRHANINTTLVCSRNLDRVSQAGEFAVDRMLGES